MVDQLRPDQADAVRAVVRQLVAVTGTAEAAPDQPRRRFSFDGSISAEPDLAERSEKILEEIARRNAE